MNNIRFDFNNIFEFNIGSKDGISEIELQRLSGLVDKCHNHLQAIINHPVNRVNLNLQWAKLPFQDANCTGRVQKLGEKIAKKYENVLFLGIGGSFLGLKAAQDALSPAYYNDFNSLRRGRPRIYFEGNNLDPQTLKVLLDNLNPKKTCMVVISKSGETTETKAAFMVVEAWLKRFIGKEYGRQVIAITDPSRGSLRKKIDEVQEKDPLSFRDLPLLKGVGGRYSEFNMGLLHLAIMGVDIRETLAGAKVMARRCSESSIYRNPAYMYAVLHYLLYKKKGKDIAIMMPFSENLKSTADWYVQLLAESLGKKYERKIKVSKNGTEEWLENKNRIVNTGRTPISARGTNDLHSIQQNNVEGENNKAITFVRVEKFEQDIFVPKTGDFLSRKSYSTLLKLAQEATEWALVRANRPNCAIILPEISAYTWGQLIFFLEMATAFEGELLNVNAFDQPGVESYKNYMYFKLNKPGQPKIISRQIKKHPLKTKSKFIV